MKFCIDEILNNIKRNIFSVIIIIISVISIVSIGLLVVINYNASSQVKDYKEVYNERHFYTLMDDFVGDKYFELTKSGVENKLSEFNTKLLNSKYFEYYMMYNQPVYVADYNGSEKNIYGYEHKVNINNDKVILIDKKGVERTSTNLKGFWIGENVLNDFKLDLLEGGGFSQDDFILKDSNNNISVILGANYNDVYNVGDKIYISFIFSEREAEIIGFLEEGSNIYYSGDYVNLDRYVIMPIFTNDKYNGKSVFDIKISDFYTLRNSGIIATKLNIEDVKNIVQQYSESTGLGNSYYIDEYAETQLETMGIGLESIGNIIKIIGIISVISNVLIMIFYIIYKLNTSKRYFGVLAINGCDKIDIYKIMVGEILILLLISFIIGVLFVEFFLALFNIKTIIKSYIAMIIISILPSILPTIYSAFTFFQKDLSEYMKEDIRL